MIPDWSEILSFVKESSRTFFIVGGTCLLLLFFSESLGTESIRDATRPVLVVLLIVCGLGIAYSIGEGAIRSGRLIIDARARRRNTIRRLSMLTEYEKFILSAYFKEGVRSKSLDSNDGSVAELHRIGVIFQSTPYMDWGSHCKYNVTDWAWDYLAEHPELLNESA